MFPCLHGCSLRVQRGISALLQMQRSEKKFRRILLPRICNKFVLSSSVTTASFFLQCYHGFFFPPVLPWLLFSSSVTTASLGNGGLAGSGSCSASHHVRIISVSTSCSLHNTPGHIPFSVLGTDLSHECSGRGTCDQGQYSRTRTHTRVPCTHVTNHQCRCKCRSRYTNGDCSPPLVLKMPLAEGPRAKIVYISPNAWNGPLPVKDIDEIGCEKTLEEGGCDHMRCDKSKTKHVKTCTDVDDSGRDDSDCSRDDCRSHCKTNEDLSSSHFAFDVGDRECYIFEECINMQSNKDHAQYVLVDATASATAALQEALQHTSLTWVMCGLLATIGKTTIRKTTIGKTTLSKMIGKTTIGKTTIGKTIGKTTIGKTTNR